VPVRAYNVAGEFSIDGRPPPPPGHEPLRFVNGVTPDFFATLDITLRAGRTFSAADNAQASPVVIINETMARTFWPDESPLGQRISGEEIIGVVADVEFAADPSEPSTRLQSYRPFAQSPRNFLALAVRGKLGRRLAGVELPARARPFVAALFIRVVDRLAAAETLRRGGFAPVALKDGSYAVHAHEACGVTLVFG